MAADEQSTECIVQDVASSARNALVGGPFGSDLVSKDYVSSGVPVIRGTNMGHGRWVAGEFAFVTTEKANSLAANCAKPGDLIFTQRGTLGQVALVPAKGSDRYLISQSQMKLTVDEAKADTLFLYYVFTSAEQQEYIRQNAIQTGVPHTNLGILRNTPLTLPPLAEQKAIAAILGALDDKIELNRRMNATLEAMAQALFQSWFVDFDPVRAKLDGRSKPALDHATAAQFADSFQDSKLGHIPTGWRVTTVGEMCQAIFSGGTPSTQNAEYWGGDIPWLSSGETRSAFIIGTEKTITKAGVENSSTRAARAGCTVIAGAGQGHTRGQTSLLTFASYVNQSVVALAANPAVSSDLFLFFDLARRYDEFRQLSDSHSSRGSLTTKLLADVRCVLPPHELVVAFDNAVRPFVERIVANLRQSHTLATLRDTMLPKLLSGELAIQAL
jgi:type I restriction enzyme, S subunit